MMIKSTIINDDAFVVLDELISEKIKVDCIITDPPYGRINGLQLTGQNKKVDWDETIDWNLFFKKANQVLKKGGTILMFGQGIQYSKMILANEDNFKYEYIWVKNNCAQGFHADKMPLVYHEKIAVFLDTTTERIFNKITNKKYDEYLKENFPIRYLSKMLLRKLKTNFNLSSRKKIYERLPRLWNKKTNQYDKLNRKLEFFFFWNGTLFNLPSLKLVNTLTETFKINHWKEIQNLKEEIIKPIKAINNLKNKICNPESLTTILNFKKDKGSYHPTQKPVALLEKLIKIYTNEDDLVLDPFAGSGSTAIAAINCKRNYVMVEKNWDFCKVMKERIQNEKTRNT